MEFRLGGELYGVETGFIGAIGNDAFGKEVQEFVSEEEFLKPFFYHDQNNPTGAAAIIVNEKGQNLITVALGANDHLPPSFIESLKDEVGNSSILLCQLESNLDSTAEALLIASGKSLIRILNPAPINQSFDPDLLQYVNVITPNESEFLYLVKRMGYSSEYTTQTLIEEAINYPSRVHELCNEIPVDTTVITLGDMGCFVSHRNKSEKGYYHSPAKAVTTVDTTGAGDAFSGGLAAGLIKNNYDFEKAIKYATAVAALSTTKQGTAPSMPTAYEVNNFLK